MENTFELIVIILLLVIITEVYLLTRPKRRYETKSISMLVDTSVLMDGRVVALARTGFLLGQIIVPRSVLAELQLLADGADHDKRERARLGLDAVKQLQDILGDSFKLLSDDTQVKNGVDERLMVLAKETDSAILTLDYNLNKVAQVEGIEVLNINELAKSIRLVQLPGDKLEIELTQKGQSADQAVGYLQDGTMVVVEQAKKQIGKTVEIEITRSLQTDAGKMMFAQLVPIEKPKTATRGRTKTSSKKKNVSKTTQAKTKIMRRVKPKTTSQRENDLIKLANKS